MAVVSVHYFEGMVCLAIVYDLVDGYVISQDKGTYILYMTVR